MTGRIVYEPTHGHHCDVNKHGILHRDGHDSSHGVAAGTVWECDCGRTFVAQRWRPGEMFPRWVRESRIARWRRQDRQDRSPGLHGPPPSRPDPSLSEVSGAVPPGRGRP